jgi:hypothetical protein
VVSGLFKAIVMHYTSLLNGHFVETVLHPPLSVMNQTYTRSTFSASVGLHSVQAGSVYPQRLSHQKTGFTSI